MLNANRRDVVRDPWGAWDVKASGARRASAHQATRSRAERQVKRIAQSVGDGEVRIRNRDCCILDSDTMAAVNDPSPAREITR